MSLYETYIAIRKNNNIQLVEPILEIGTLGGRQFVASLEIGLDLAAQGNKVEPIL